VTSHLDQVQSFCAAQRWFGEKGHDVNVDAMATSAWLSDEGAWPAVRIGFVYCAGPPGAENAIRVYQLPLSYYREPVEQLAHAHVGTWEEPDLEDT
jgi:maltokinase